MDEDKNEELENFLEQELKTRLQTIPEEFKKVPFNPLPSVVKVLQSDDRNEKVADLEDHFDAMESALNMIVEVYYKGFNKSIRNYSNILDYVINSQQNVQNLKKDLKQTTKFLSSRSKVLKSMWKENLEYKEVIKILEKIEELKQAPQKLQGYIESKHYLHASKLLVSSHTTLFGEDLLDVGALVDLRKDILERKNTFHEEIIEQLHTHLYLRNPQAQKDSSTEAESIESISRMQRRLTESDGPSFRSVAEDNLDDVVEDMSKDNSLNSHYYMKLLAEALHTLDRIPTALATINNQIAIQLRVIIAQAMKIVKDRANTTLPAEDEDVVPFGMDFGDRRPLSQLVDILLPQFLSILRNHLFLSDLFISKYLNVHSAGTTGQVASPSMRNLKAEEDPKVRRYFTNSYTLESVLRILQLEVENFLRIHLGSHTDLIVSVPTDSASESTKDKVKLFTFAGSSAATFKGYKDEAASTNLTGLPDPIVKPSPYNLPVCYPQILKFDADVNQLIAHKKSEFGLKYFIDEYVTNTFLPHIKSDYKKRSELAIEGPDAFKPRERLKNSLISSSRPLLQGAMDAFIIIQELYVDVNMMSKYSTEFIAIIETVLVKYIDKCKSKYHDITENTETGNRLATQEFYQFLTNDPLWRALKHSGAHANRNRSGSSSSGGSHDDIDSDSFHEAELNQELPLYGNNSIQKSQGIFDTQKLILLANLNDSLEWLAVQIENLGNTQEPNNKLDKKKKQLLQEKINKPTAPPVSASSAKLTQNLELLAKRLRNLSDYCLLALRVEMRIHCYYFMDGVKQASYWLDEESIEPDTFIVELNKDLSTNEEVLQPYLYRGKLKYLFDGLAHLISSILFQSLTKISKINRYGVMKMCRNVFALQQNLTNLINFKEVHFDRVRKYYLLLNMSDEELLNYASSQTSGLQQNNVFFTLEEFKTILESKYQGKKVPEKLVHALEETFQKRLKS